MLYIVTILRSIQDSHWLRCSDHKMNYDIFLMVNSINHPEFKSTFSMKYPFPFKVHNTMDIGHIYLRKTIHTGDP